MGEGNGGGKEGGGGGKVNRFQKCGGSAPPVPTSLVSHSVRRSTNGKFNKCKFNNLSIVKIKIKKLMNTC